MAESKVRDDNFFLVSGWMLNRLNLKGVPLQVFSIIYGFSQDGEGSFTGSLQYLCDFTNASKNTILKALKELVDQQYITKSESTINGVRFCTYKTNAPVVQKLNRGGAENEPGGCAETEPNNISSYNNNSLIDKEKVKEVQELYNTICVSYPTLRVLSDKRKKAIKKILGRFSMEDIRTVFENAESSSFMKDGKWATFDWMMKEDNLVKVLEGNYADKAKRRKEVVPGWAVKTQDDYLDGVDDAYMQKMYGVTPTAGNDPELADRAEKLRKSLGGR